MNSRSKEDLGASGEGSETDLTREQKRDLVQRIIGSQQFARSARLQDFLQYVCTCALENRLSEINEQRIGERVFERPPDYNQNEDNIVRSHARLLRQKLDAFFASEGRDEPFILRIPKGGYTPEFVTRPINAPVESLREPSEVVSQWQTPLVRVLLGIIAILVVSVVVMGWLLRTAKPAPPDPLANAPSVRALWSKLFSEGLTTSVIVPDHTFAMLQEASDQYVDLATYLRGAPRIENDNVRELERILPSFSIRRYTTFDGASTAVRVSQLANQLGGRVSVRYARDMDLRSLSPGHVVVVGRPLSNPWYELFESKLNFRFHSDLARNLIVCRNMSPQPGEQSEYLPVNEGARRTVYASVSFLPNLNNEGNALIIAGNSSGSQELAAEFATNEKLLGGLSAKIRTEQSAMPYFETLIRTTTLNGLAQEPEVLAYRLVKP